MLAQFLAQFARTASVPEPLALPTEQLGAPGDPRGTPSSARRCPTLRGVLRRAYFVLLGSGIGGGHLGTTSAFSIPFPLVSRVRQSASDGGHRRVFQSCAAFRRGSSLRTRTSAQRRTHALQRSS